jgi:hypothetical protein
MLRLRPSIIAFALLFGVLLYGASLKKPLFAQEKHCDPNLKQATDNPNGYYLRGDRCEGEYIKPVASTRLRVVSLTEYVEDFNPTSNRPLLVEWTAPKNAGIHLQAHALRHRLYYQMDTIRPEGSSSYTWPSNLLSTFNLKRNELGFVAWASYLVGNTEREVYVPLLIRQQNANIRSGSYKVVLLPGAELSEVFISLAPVGPDGRAGAFVKRDEPLGYGNYPAEQGITITLPVLKTPGIYRLEIGATLRAGGSSTVPPVWFYHPSN